MTRGDTSLGTSTSRLPDEQDTGMEQGQQQGDQSGQSQPQLNVSEAERAVSVAAGAIAAMTGLSRGGLPGLLITAVGGGLMYRGYTGHCPAYQRLGIDSTQDDGGVSAQERLRRGIHVEQAWLINKSPQELYDFWRNFENFPSFMSHLKSVRKIDEKRSHWTADAPSVAGGEVEWEAEITRDEPNELIAWRSLPGSSVANAGQVRFSPAMGDRGTEVHVFLDYLPPGGRLGQWIAKLTSGDAEKQIHDDLRNVKRLLETGEIPTTSGQPRGSCIG